LFFSPIAADHQILRNWRELWDREITTEFLVVVLSFCFVFLASVSFLWGQCRPSVLPSGLTQLRGNSQEMKDKCSKSRVNDLPVSFALRPKRPSGGMGADECPSVFEVGILHAITISIERRNCWSYK